MIPANLAVLHVTRHPPAALTAVQLATPTEFSLMKQQIRGREGGGWARTVWALAERPALSDLEMVRARLIMVDPKVRTAVHLCGVTSTRHSTRLVATT